MIDQFYKFLGAHTNDQWERFIVWLIVMVVVYWIILREDSRFKLGFKGDDKLWQAAEAIVYIFIYMLPSIVLSNFFLGYKIDDNGMWIIEAILLTALGVRGLVQGVKTWKEKDKPKTE